MLGFRTPGSGNRASARELRVDCGGEDNGRAREVVEDGHEGHGRRQICRAAFVWWSGKCYLRLRTFLAFKHSSPFDDFYSVQFGNVKVS